jgi:hypothetical protein
MKALIFITLVLALSSALTANQRESIEKIRQSGWGKVVLDLAELHMESKGPIEELIKAIEDLAADLNTRLEAEETAYTTATNKHEEEVRRLNGEIAQAKLDISNT